MSERAPQVPQLASGEKLETRPVSGQSFSCPILYSKDLGVLWKPGHGGHPRLSALRPHLNSGHRNFPGVSSVTGQRPALRGSLRPRKGPLGHLVRNEVAS